MDLRDSGQSFLGLMASIQQFDGNFLSSMMNIHSEHDAACHPEAQSQSFFPVLGTQTEEINHVCENTTKRVRASSEKRGFFFEAMLEQPAESSAQSLTENSTNASSDQHVVLSDTDNVYDSSCSSTCRRRKRRWAGTDLLMGNPKFAGAIEMAIRNADKRATTNICQPYQGQSFESLAEAYQFYNLHSWEAGFSIRHGASQTNTKKD